MKQFVYIGNKSRFLSAKPMKNSRLPTIILHFVDWIRDDEF